MPPPVKVLSLTPSTKGHKRGHRKETFFYILDYPIVMKQYIANIKGRNNITMIGCKGSVLDIKKNTITRFLVSAPKINIKPSSTPKTKVDQYEQVIAVCKFN
ncbi:hypothetical protein O6H91_01G057500 [Diphasiastrum complanatum]|uniref:Uncharacterized protein n=1 Tax=Diphasiastrum complanatum TaxID=34168 RepID=A0ACC2ER76_DIPCM|nr:hypothetical protein O6H91_01G057500 [Diphasiastrum complanatum]